MGTIAEKYIDEGMKLGEAIGRAEGRAEGIELGEARGRAEGRAEGVEFGEARGMQLGEAKAKKELAMKLLKSGFPNEFVSENTGLSKQEILALKDSID